MNITLDANKIKKHDLFRWADFVELTCLNDPDGEAPLSEVLREAWGFETGMGASFREEGFPDDTSDIEDRATYDDTNQVKMEDLLKHFEMRSVLLGENYPFEVKLGDETICRKESCSSHELYQYLLYSANLPFVSQSDSSALSKGFERLAYRAVKKMMPPSAQIALFGTAATGSYKCYTGSKYEKLGCFADELDTKLNSEITSSTYPPTDNGDGGLDVVAWIPFNDRSANQPLLLAQAGCTCDESTMLSKQHEVDQNKWRQKIDGIWPINMMITPLCYRGAGGKWVKPTEIVSIFIDRIRLMILLSDQAPDFTHEDIPFFAQLV